MRLVLALGGLLAMGATSPAWAADAGGAAPAAAAGGPASETDATVLIKQAAQQYDEGLLDEALQTLERARALSPQPGIIYNIAQIHRAKQDCAAALAAYKSFTAQTPPTDPHHQRALRWQAEMQACVDGRAASDRANATKGPLVPAAATVASAGAPASAQASLLPAAPARPGEEVGRVTAQPPPPDQKPRRAYRIAGWSLLGAAVVAGTAAVVLELKAKDIESRLGQLGDTNNPVSGDTYNNLKGDGQRDALWALVTGVSAGLFAVGGGALLFVSRSSGVSGPPVALLGWTGAF
ncbi:MAG TPA: hypothetical protein VH475_14285 [Tepidisphaeraceae bacterium]|jgi:hypothetical protein